MKKIMIAIDGVAACGKSVTASRLAHILNYLHFDSGSMYRAVAHYFITHNIAITDTKEVYQALADIDITFKINHQRKATEIYLNGANVENEIRNLAVSEWVSHVSALKEIRQTMVKIQQKLGENKGIVMDGRDIGTTVFPHAELKLFMTANLATRGLRRLHELPNTPHKIHLNDMINSLKKRDQCDSTRKISPLQKAKDAIVLNTTYMTINEQIDEAVRLSVTRIINNK